MKDLYGRGILNTVVGKAEETIGKATDNPELETRGTVKRVKGAIQGKAADAQDVVRRQLPRY